MTRTPYLRFAVAPILAALLLAIPLAADALRLAPVKDPAVAKECSACHMLYPAGRSAASPFLVNDHRRAGQSLRGITPSSMLRLPSALPDYLAANAADHMGISSKVLRGLDPALVPKRITELPWWTRKHEKKGRVGAVELACKGAKFKGDCKACHADAERGIFDDDE